MRGRIRKTAKGWLVDPAEATAESAPFNDGDDVIVTHERPVGEESPDDLVDATAAKAQLDLVLSFFGRVETKLSVVLAIDLGMLSLAFSKAAPFAHVPCFAWVALGLFAGCQGMALLALYRGSFPRLAGGHASLVYFREIAMLRESDYTGRFTRLSKEALSRDHLEQAWRNAKILTTKFNQLEKAYGWTALGIVPWLGALAMLAAGEL